MPPTLTVKKLREDYEDSVRWGFMTSIRRQLTAALLFGFTALIGGSGLILYFSIKDTLYDKLDKRLEVEAATIAALTKQEQTYIQIGFEKDYIEEFHKKFPIRFFQLWHPEGQTLHRSEPLIHHHKQLPKRFGTVEQPKIWNLKLPNGMPGRALGFRFVPETDRGDRRHYDPNFRVGLVVAGDRSAVQQTLASLRFNLAGFGILTLTGGVFLVWITLRKNLAPLQRVASEADVIGSQSLHRRFPEKGLPDELVPICCRLNAMLESVEASLERERRFSSDIAHELRTPLAELRSVAEMRLTWSEADVKEEPSAMRDILNISMDMERIVEQLLALSRCEQGRAPVREDRIELKPFIESQWEPFAHKAAHRSITPYFIIPGDLKMKTDPSLFASLVNNLLSNAVDYTPPGKWLSVRTEFGDNHLKLAFRNPCPDLTKEDLPKLFERFWRKDDARSAAEHSGLGLSLVCAISELLELNMKASFPEAEVFQVALIFHYDNHHEPGPTNG